MTKVKVVEHVIKKKGAPAYMVSFGDMMTLILCFFILLVAMSKERNYGMLAKGLGSFVISIKSFGLTGIMDAQEQQSIHEQVRRRFNLPPEDDPERRTDLDRAASEEMVRAEVVQALRPRRELRLPALARFAPDQTELDADARRHLDAQAASLRPAPDQVLLLQGHAPAPDSGAEDPTWMAYRRAAAVREYLVERHNFSPRRVEARAYLVEIADDPRMTDVVHARLVLPGVEAED